MRNPEQLEADLKKFIVQTLALDEVDPATLDAEMPLFGDGLGLDSVDALELGIALKKQFGITVDPKGEDTRAHFYNVRSLARLVARSADPVA